MLMPSISFFSTELWFVLFPLTYVLHFAEEHLCGEGYPAYLHRIRGVEISTTRFVVLEAIGLVLMLIFIGIAVSCDFPQFAVVLFAAIVLTNGISHTATAAWDGRYGPGLFVSAVIWIPMGAVALWMMFGSMATMRFGIAASIGTAISIAVGIIAMNGGKMWPIATETKRPLPSKRPIPETEDLV